jgi:4-hydroxybenzoate polyprenyltransferase
MRRLLLVALLGAGLGLLASLNQSLQWLTLLPWGIAAVLVGYSSATRRSAVADGAAFGFALGFVFIAAGYAGSAPILARLPFFAALGVVSAVAGLVASVVGRTIRAGVVRAR